MAPDEIDWSLPERQTRAVAEFLAGLDDEDPDANRKLPKVISPSRFAILNNFMRAQNNVSATILCSETMIGRNMLETFCFQ
jgi:hypothetical protein